MHYEHKFHRFFLDSFCFKHYGRMRSHIHYRITETDAALYRSQVFFFNLVRSVRVRDFFGGDGDDDVYE